MKSKITTAILLASFVIYSGCDTEPISDAIDDFTLVVSLDEINTGMSMIVYDYQTNELIDQNVSIEFDEESAEHTVDLLSDPIKSDEFTGGIYNVGISNEVMPTTEEPLNITMTINTQGYFSKTMSVSLSDTGLTSIDVELYPENNPPENYVTTEITAERDADGNPKPLDIPFDTTDGSSNLPTSIKTKSTVNVSEFNTFSFPFILVEEESSVVFPDGTNVRWEFEDGSSFVGNPSQYLIQTRVWSTNPSLVQGGFGPGRLGFAMTFHEVISFKAKTVESGDQFKEVASITPVNEDEVVHILLATRNPDAEIPNAIDWFDKFVKTTTGCTISENCEGGIEAGDIVAGFITTFYRASVGTFSLPNWLVNNKDFAADQPIVYTLYSDRDNKDEFLQKLVFTHSKHTYPDTPEFDPIYTEYTGSSDEFFEMDIRLNLPSGISSRDVTFNFTNAGFGFTTRFINNPTRLRSFLPTYTRFTITGKGLYHTEVRDFTDVQGESHEITIDVPAPPSNTVSAKVTANLVCEDPSQKVSITEPPLATYRYREVGSTDRYVTGDKIKWNYDKDNQQLKSGNTTLHGVQVGKTYKVKLTIAGESKTTDLTIDSEDFSFTQEVPNDYCNM